MLLIHRHSLISIHLIIFVFFTKQKYNKMKMDCPKCNNTRYCKAGFALKRQRYYCRLCNYIITLLYGVQKIKCEIRCNQTLSL